MILRNALSWFLRASTTGVRHRRTKMQGVRDSIEVHPEVQSSLQRGDAVVALESTIITHGMPYPQNLETAREVERVVRENGAVPATIAIIDGQIKVGLTESDLLKLANKRRDEVVKCSRRDLPFLVAQRRTGGTTVAATMILANMAGLPIFATGGIGGVHREGHITMDISADLVELGRTPVAVVCSGVKSILDIPRTLEYLETQGVCVATYGCDGGQFPDFYTRDSGYKVPYNLRNPTEAAQLIHTLKDLQMQSGILIGVPIPAAHAADKAQISAAIDEAYEEARTAGISGKEVTPFLLNAIANTTKGNSLSANISLIKNNAKVAAQIATALCEKTGSERASQVKRAPLIVGASILDLSLTMTDEMPESLDGATYETQSKQSAGGVGRNLAEGIFKLHGKAKFISVVGNDQFGQSLLKLMPEPLQQDVAVDDTNATSLCSVIFDKKGDCKLILGNMEIHQSITPAHIYKQERLLREAPLIIMDGNLPADTMECILRLAREYRRPVFFEPTDMRISGRPFILPPELTDQIKIISPNIFELKTIVEVLTKTPVDWTPNMALPTEEILAQGRQMLQAIQSHFDCILLTMGHHGVLVSLRGPSNEAFHQPLFDPSTGDYCEPSAGPGGHFLRHYAVPRIDLVANVSGAGDSFSSGFITGLLRGDIVERCIAMGFAAAERALSSESAVPPRYYERKEEELLVLQDTMHSMQRRDI